MREIKFRAWDTEEKEMIENVSSEYGKTPISDILMQYTGLKDKNGKEIYENDHLLVVEDVVVETIGGYHRTEPEGTTKIVEWKEGAFWWGDELLNEYAQYGEVIGNTFEGDI